MLDPVYPDRSARAHAEIERLMNTCYEAMSDFFDEHSIPVPRDADNAEALKAHSRGGKKKHRKGKTADAVVSDPEMCNS